MGPPGWSVDRIAGVLVVRCDALGSIPDVAHAFSTRQGPDGEHADVGGPEADGPEAVSRRRGIQDAAGLTGRPIVLLRQVHGRRVLRAAEAHREATPPEADGVVALRGDRPSVTAAVRTADCLPVLLADREGRAVAAVHAGWRGTAAAIVPQAVERLRELGVRPSTLVAALGPAIGPCCYEVGTEVVTAVERAVEGIEVSPARPRNGRYLLDLQQANAFQLERAGVEPRAIHTAPFCTACREDLFFSFRRDGGAAGRQIALIGWREGAAPRAEGAAP